MYRKETKGKVYAFWILATEAVGALSGFLTREGTQYYSANVKKPPLSPPAVVFPIVWAILYALMGTGAARVTLSENPELRKRCLRIYLLQLGFNFCWSLIFFNLRAYSIAFFWLAALWGLIVWMILSFLEADRTAGLLQIPYALWVLFAGYLNLGVWLLNR